MFTVDQFAEMMRPMWQTQKGKILQETWRGALNDRGLFEAAAKIDAPSVPHWFVRRFLAEDLPTDRTLWLENYPDEPVVELRSYSIDDLRSGVILADGKRYQLITEGSAREIAKGPAE